jgi:hypothetical protein
MARTNPRYRLEDEGTGCFEVTTECSTYLVDLARRQLMRIPGTGSPGPRSDGVTAFLSPLPRDNEWVPLQELLTCQVGEPLTALTERVPGFSVVFRQSTHVLAIREIDVDGAGSGPSC